MTRKELAQQALTILKGENEQLYNTLSYYIGCLEMENEQLKQQRFKVKVYNNERNAWWRSDYLGYTTDENEAGIYDYFELEKSYGKSFMTFNTKAKNYLVKV